MNPLAVDYRLTTPIALHARFDIRGFTALLGRSGAGKTSLLKALAGLLPAVGTPWGALPPEQRPVGYVPQNPSLFPHLTVLQNAAFALTGQDRLQIAGKILHDLGIADLATRRANEISGGEAQRAALARALAAGPDLLLLDEPSAALDAATRDAVFSQLIDAIALTQKPALAATHDFAVAALADWVVLVAGGAVIQQGTPRDVFERPASAAAAQLVGYENIWVEAGKTLAIRARHVELAPTGRAAVIAAVRAQGADLRLTCAGDPPFIAILPETNVNRYEPGQTVHLGFPEKYLKFIGEEAGKQLLF